MVDLPVKSSLWKYTEYFKLLIFDLLVPIFHFIILCAVDNLSKLSSDLIVCSQDKSFVEFALSENSLSINTHFN